MFQIQRLNAAECLRHLTALVVLLQDTVDSGASVGFLPPLSSDEANQYWSEVIEDIRRQHQIMLVAMQGDQIVGSVQLALATRANGRHRAEVQKLMVHRQARHQGIGRALMTAVEAIAQQEGRSLLVLDTRQGDASEQLYAKIGYLRSGVIPQYARSADGSLHTTVFFYKLLETLA